jgi:hypothetical protein
VGPGNCLGFFFEANMSRYRLIKAFEDKTTLPIDLNEVSDWLIKHGIQDEINFVPVNLDPEGAIRGFIRRYRRSGGVYAESDAVSNIYYDARQPVEWQNLVCAKELLHILDGACVTTREAFEKLTQRLILPYDLSHLADDPDFALVDKVGTAPACALLLPLAVRELLLPAYKAGLVTAAEIARQAVMPVEYVRSVMSDIWPTVYDVIRADHLAVVRDVGEPAAAKSGRAR